MRFFCCLSIFALFIPWGVDARTPNDPYYSVQWYLGEIRAPAAWDITTGAGSVVVAVIDDGIDMAHPDFEGNVWENSDEIAGNGIDDDGNGAIDDRYGFDFSIPRYAGISSLDDLGGTYTYYGNELEGYVNHGTTVASLIAARGNNARDLSGVAWNTKIMNLSIFQSSNLEEKWFSEQEVGIGSLANATTTFRIYDAIMYAVDNGADIINLSFSFGNHELELVEEALAYADSKGVLVIAAAGNYGRDTGVTPDYPSCSEFVMGVAATDQLQKRAVYDERRSSNYGSCVDIAAPGKDIPGLVYDALRWQQGEDPRLVLREDGSAVPYEFANGTSYAAPLVSGAAALIKARYPSATHHQIKERLLESARSLADADPAYGDKLGAGLLDVAAALANPILPVAQEAPHHPTHLRFENKGDGSSIVVRWDKPYDASVDTAAVYRKAVDESAWRKAYEGSGSALLSSGLREATMYYYWIAGLDEQGNPAYPLIAPDMPYATLTVSIEGVEATAYGFAPLRDVAAEPDTGKTDFSTLVREEGKTIVYSLVGSERFVTLVDLGVSTPPGELQYKDFSEYPWVDDDIRIVPQGYLRGYRPSSRVSFVPVEEIPSQPEASDLPEGALIRAIGNVDVYIVKYVGSKKFKRLILSPSVFENYGHLRWEDIIEVDQATLQQFITSNLVRAVGDDRVFLLSPQGDTGERQWIPTADIFNAQGFDWDAIYEINAFDRDSYREGAAIVLAAAVPSSPAGASAPNDIFYAEQWYLEAINAPSTWDITTGNPEVVVAVIDSGIDGTHPELKDAMWVNTEEIAGNGIDDEGNGYIDDVNGWNFYCDCDRMTPTWPHGTEVAGIIGAAGNNEEGIAGMSWGARLMPLTVCEIDLQKLLESGTVDIDVETLLEWGCNTVPLVGAAMRYAADNGADVINLSIAVTHVMNGAIAFTSDIDDDIRYAYSRGVVIVAAAGNGDIATGTAENLDEAPKSPVCNDVSSNMVIGVGATAYQSSDAAPWSNYGACVDIYAPGENMLTTMMSEWIIPTDAYITDSGTSFAAPLVSGVAALLKVKYPAMSAADIRDRILRTASGSVLDAYAALREPDGTLVKTESSGAVYRIENGLKRPIPSLEMFNAYGFRWEGIVVVSQGEMDSFAPGDPLGFPVDTSYLPEGALIRAIGNVDVYIVKYVGVPSTDSTSLLQADSGQAKKFKRLILSPSVFENYGHLRWEDVIEVDQATLQQFTTSNLVRAVGDDRVFLLSPQGDTGQRQWIPTADIFNAQGFDWDAIYEINAFDRDSYTEGTPFE